MQHGENLRLLAILMGKKDVVMFASANHDFRVKT